jgi:hypothetical protein
MSGQEYLSRCSEPLRTGDRILVWARLSAPVKTDLEAHLTSYRMSTGLFLGAKRPKREVNHLPGPAPKLNKE